MSFAPLKQSERPRIRTRGFTLLEALLLVTVLAITGVATGRALTSMIHSPKQNDSDLSIETALLDKMEFLHSLSFATLAAEVGKSQSAYTDNVTISGASSARVVSVAYIVPSTGAVSGSPTNMLQLAVSLNGKSFVTLVNQP